MKRGNYLLFTNKWKFMRTYDTQIKWACLFIFLFYLHYQSVLFAWIHKQGTWLSFCEKKETKWESPLVVERNFSNEVKNETQDDIQVEGHASQE